MGEVVSLNQIKEDRSPHVSGAAKCLECKHEWHAVAPVKTDWLECPGCGLVKGRFKYNHVAGDTMVFWICNCGNDLFFLTPDGPFCPNCGNWPSLEELY